jgi:hypothetical protein
MPTEIDIDVGDTEEDSVDVKLSSEDNTEEAKAAPEADTTTVLAFSLVLTS